MVLIRFMMYLVLMVETVLHRLYMWKIIIYG